MRNIHGRTVAIRHSQIKLCLIAVHPQMIVVPDPEVKRMVCASGIHAVSRKRETNQ